MSHPLPPGTGVRNRGGSRGPKPEPTESGAKGVSSHEDDGTGEGRRNGEASRSIEASRFSLLLTKRVTLHRSFLASRLNRLGEHEVG